MNKQEQIDALRARIEQIEAKFAEQHNQNRSEKPNSSEAGNNHQLFHISIHELITAEVDPYQVDWSKAPEWADSHSYDSDGIGWWFGSEMLLNAWRGDWDKSNLILPSGLDWKQSKRRRPQ